MDRKSFQAWLDAQPQEATVGYVGLPDSCPLRTYLGRGHVGILTWYPNATNGLAFVLLPRWAVLFIQEVDKMAPKTQVQAWQALEFLARVEE